MLSPKKGCADAKAARRAQGGLAYRFVYVDQAGFEAHQPQDFMGLELAFRDDQH